MQNISKELADQLKALGVYDRLQAELKPKKKKAEKKPVVLPTKKTYAPFLQGGPQGIQLVEPAKIMAPRPIPKEKTYAPFLQAGPNGPVLVKPKAKSKKFVTKVVDKQLLDNQLSHSMYHVQPWAVTESTIKYLADEINTLIHKQAEQVVAPGGYNMYVKLYCADMDHTKWFTFVLDAKNITEKDLFAKLANISKKNYPTADYIIFLYRIETIISKLDVAGGCCTSQYKSERLKSQQLIIKSLRSKDHNCLIACYNKHYGVKVEASKLRIELNIPAGPIGMEWIPKISGHFNTLTGKSHGYWLINQNCETILRHLTNATVTDFIYLYLRDEHYYLCEEYRYIKCIDCGRKLRDNNVTHKCNVKRKSYYQRENGNFVKVRNIRDDHKIDYDNVIHWDLETFQDGCRHVPYAYGWYNKTVKTNYGKNAIDSAVNEFITYENKIVSAYNGAGFDFYFLIDSLTEKGTEIKNLILSNGRVMSFEFGNNNKVFDLCLFLTCSLDKACKSYNTKVKKSSFDHMKIKTWSDVDLYEDQVKPYLDRDVLALKEPCSPCFNATSLLILV